MALFMAESPSSIKNLTKNLLKEYNIFANI